MDAARRRHFERLVSALCDGVMDARQHFELEQRLRDSAECRAIYLQYVDMHVRLSAHPHLSAGLPISANTDAVAAGESFQPSDLDTAPNRDDEVVLELARASLDRLAEDARRARRQSRLIAVGRWLSLGLVVLVAILGWQVYQHWRDIRESAVVGRVDGIVEIVSERGLSAAQVGQRLQPGQRLHTGEEDARAVLEYADGTRIIIGSNSAVEVPAGRSGIHLRLVSGAMEVDAAPQRPEEPLVFVTDHARYVVLGTRFRLYRESGASRLELDEGKVRLQRQVDGRSVDVEAGYVAVATSEEAPLEVHPLASARSELTATFNKAGEAVAFSPDGSRFGTADWQRGLRTWRPDAMAPLEQYQDKVHRSDGLVFLEFGLVHLSEHQPHAAVTCWRPGDGKAQTIELAGDRSRSRTLSPDGKYAAESDNEGTHLYELDLERAKSKSLPDLPNKGKAWCLALARGATFTAAGFWDGTVRVHQTLPGSKRYGEIVFETRLHHTPTKIALSDDARRLAVFSRKDGLLLIDPASGGQRLIWAGCSASVTCLKFTADGERLLAGLSDGTARMWRVDDGEALIVVDTGHAPRDVAWSPQQSLLVTAGGKVKVWRCEIP